MDASSISLERWRKTEGLVALAFRFGNIKKINFRSFSLLLSLSLSFFIFTKSRNGRAIRKISRKSFSEVRSQTIFYSIGNVN